MVIYRIRTYEVETWIRYYDVEADSVDEAIEGVLEFNETPFDGECVEFEVDELSVIHETAVEEVRRERWIW